MGGSMGVAVGEAVVAGVEQAIKRGCPYVAITAAGGARMQEGTLSLMQMPRATVALARLRRAGLPRSEEHTSELQSLMRISYAVFCLKKKKKTKNTKVTIKTTKVID